MTFRILRAFVSLSIVLLTACDRTELPVSPHDSGNLQEASVAMGSDYRWQMYYDLESQQLVGQNLKTVWDLAFDASADGFYISLNSAKLMFAAPVADTALDAVTDTTGFFRARRWDASAGPAYGNAFGDWRGQKPVYWVDGGYDETGIHQGFVKVQLLSVTPQAYTFRFASLQGGPTQYVTLAKDSTYNRVFFSFKSGQPVLVEPPKKSWDLVFTQYTHTFPEEDSTAYLVTGCLLNSPLAAALEDTAFAFESWDYATAGSLSFSTAQDIIGYDWKTFSGLNYIINNKQVYIIRSRSGYLYKLRFVDFYDENGIKGSPRWEYQRL